MRKQLKGILIHLFLFQMPPKRSRPGSADKGAESVEPQLPQRTMTRDEVANIVAQAVTAAISAMAHQPAVQAAQAHLGPSLWERVREDFRKGHPPEFSGGIDVMAASRWKNSMQRHLRMVECSEVQKQFLATFKLTGAALHWWESVTTSEQRDALPIADFWELFDRKYFPFAIQKEMRRKLLDVFQDDRTVAEYEEEFTRLANLVPDEVNTEEKRISKFVGGLEW